MRVRRRAAWVGVAASLVMLGLVALALTVGVAASAGEADRAELLRPQRPKRNQHLRLPRGGWGRGGLRAPSLSLLRRGRRGRTESSGSAVRIGDAGSPRPAGRR